MSVYVSGLGSRCNILSNRLNKTELAAAIFISNSLFKIVTKYNLGLSATMERKDGTTKVFKMFLGNVLFKGKNDESHLVEVRGINYCVDDDDFN